MARQVEMIAKKILKRIEDKRQVQEIESLFIIDTKLSIFYIGSPKCIVSNPLRNIKIDSRMEIFNLNI